MTTAARTVDLAPSVLDRTHTVENAHFASHKRVIFVLSLIAVSIGLWYVRWTSDQSQYMGDSYSYADRTFELAGQSSVNASVHAMQHTCTWLRHRSDADRFPGACQTGHVPSRPQYHAIFRDRVGFPLLVLGLLPLFGSAAFAAATALCAVLAALLLAVIVRLAGGSRGAALLSAALLFLVPGSTWLARVGSEAPALLGILGVIVAAMLAPRLRSGHAALALTVPSAWLFLVRPSTGVAMSLSLGLVYGWRWFGRRAVDKRRVALFAGLALAGQLLVMRLLHSPGLAETLQDTFTHHFKTRPMSGLPLRYLHLVAASGGDLASWVLHHPSAPLLSLVGMIFAVAQPKLRDASICTTFVAVSSAIAHPLYTEVPRLISATSAIGAAGLALSLVTVGSLLQRCHPLSLRRAADDCPCIADVPQPEVPVVDRVGIVAR